MNDPRIELQQVVQELQATAQQVAAIAGQLREFENTLSLLLTQESGRAVYRQSGPLLLEVDDISALESELKKSIEALATHQENMIQQESALRERYDSLAKGFEGA